MKPHLPEDLPARLFRAGQPAPRPTPPMPPALAGAVRDRMVRDRRVRRLARGAGLALAAGLAAFAVAATLRLQHGARPKAAVAATGGVAVLTPLGGKAVTLALGMPLAEGSKLVTHPGASARIELETGTELSLGPSAELELEQLSALQRFRLGAGRASASVRPLAPGQRFVLATEDAEVEVRGTRFEVESTQVDAACDVATATRVVVMEGTVMVRHGADQVTLEAPAHWPSCERVEATAPPEAEAEAAVEPAPPAPAARPSLARVPRARSVELAELNARYREALGLRRRGDVKAAVSAFEAFAERYPHSQLAEAALVEALRLHAKSDPERARAAAEAYLTHYPRGFARDEAKAMLAP